MAPVSAARKVVRAGFAGVEQVVVGQAGKAVLHAETGASAVDMESHIAAAYATEAGLPFAALRVISDPATRGLPAIARSAIKPNGNIDLKKVLGRPCAKPADVACAGIHRDRFQSGAAQPAGLPRLSVGRRGSRRGGNLTAPPDDPREPVSSGHARTCFV